MTICGNCKGTKIITVLTKAKTEIVCNICKGTGESADLKDIDGDIILPGMLVRMIPQYVPGAESKKTLGYKGRVLCTYLTSKGNPIVSILAIPGLVGDAHTHNHGFHAARPNQVRIIKETSHTKRLAKYERKKHGKT